MRAFRGATTLLAAFVTAVSFLALATIFRLPLWLAVTLAIPLFLALQTILKPSERPRLPPAERLDGARHETARALIEEGRAALDRVRSAGRGVRDPEMRRAFERLTATAEGVLGDLRDDPAKAMGVRRLLTFYLPSAASVAEGWRAVEGRAPPAPERAAQTRETLAALNDAFDRFAHALVQPQLQSLDLDLKVLNDALQADAEKDRLP